MLFHLDEDLLALHGVARNVAVEKVLPHGARVDEKAVLQQESVDALVAAELHTVGIPEEYGGQGVSLLSSVVVAEHVARVCATSQQVTGSNASSPSRCCSPGRRSRSSGGCIPSPRAQRSAPSRCPSRRPAATSRP